MKRKKIKELKEMDEIKTLLAKEATFTAARLTVLTMNWGILCLQRTAR